MGRPPNYACFLQSLDDSDHYTPAAIVALAERKGFFGSDSIVELNIAKERMRIALIHQTVRYGYPLLGDAQVRIKGQASCPAWFGWRWKLRPRRSMGRPMKYDVLLVTLDEDELYSPAAIVYHAEEHGFLTSDPYDLAAVKLERLRIRIAMGRLTKNHNFPPEGDGQLKFRGQSPKPAWKGFRWKLAAKGIKPVRKP